MSVSEQPIPAKPRLSWRGVSMLMVSDIVGTSVLTFPAVAAELGYALTVLLIVGLFPVTVYVSVLMARTHVRVRGIDSLGSAARRIFGPRYAGGTFAVVYGYTLLGNASYLLVLGTSLQGVFYDARLCLAAASGLGALLLAPLVVGLRRLGDSVALCFFNLLLVLLCVGVAFGELAARGRPPCVETHAVAQGLDFTAVFGGATNLVYAYAGQWMYFEMMTEMEAPADFPKAFLVSGPIMVSLYLLVACLGYYYLGGTPAGSLVESVPAGPAYRAAQGLLLLHVTIVYMVKSVVLARSAHGSLAAPALRRCRPRHALTRSERPTPTPRRAPRARRRRRARRARLRAPRRSLARNAALLIRRDERGPLLRAAAGAHRRAALRPDQLPPPRRPLPRRPLPRPRRDRERFSVPSDAGSTLCLVTAHAPQPRATTAARGLSSRMYERPTRQRPSYKPRPTHRASPTP